MVYNINVGKSGVKIHYFGEKFIEIKNLCQFPKEENILNLRKYRLRRTDALFKRGVTVRIGVSRGDESSGQGG